MSISDQKKLQDFINIIQPVLGVKKIILIASAKGGVGKSTIASNIALALSHLKNNVALVDADIYGPSIAYLFNINQKPNLVDNLFTPIIKHNIKTISIANLIEPNQASIFRGPMVTKILYQLIRSVNWKSDNKDVDYMIIDMPPGTGDVYLSMAEKFPINGVVLVSTPHNLAIIDLVKSIDCFNKLKIPIIGLIQNMSYLILNAQKNYLFGKDGVKNIANEKNIKFLGDIPILNEISDACNQQIPYFIEEFNKKQPNFEIINNFINISQEIIKYK
jgi:ATP-binding protein involved in chromosome partitioning